MAWALISSEVLFWADKVLTHYPYTSVQHTVSQIGRMDGRLC